uniref:U3 small nucleolar RNA-associated protein 13 C-terminal domain-containing protein n=1 Tax=Denticeps clupeoides TaxID=299321 RepID=A0AAY4BBW2_9TELE
MSTSTLQFKTNYAISSKIEPFYKGGKVQISGDEKYIFCTCGARLNVLEISTGKVLHSIEQDDQEDVTSFALSPDDEVLVTASRTLLLKQWAWRQGQLIRSWRAIHTVPVASMTFDPTSTLLATGGCDGTIKMWDVLKQYCTHNLKGSSGVVHLVEFHPEISLLQLFSSSSDCKIRAWDLRSSSCLYVLVCHYSIVTSLAFSPDGSLMVSSGRDRICTVWDLGKRAVRRTIPVYEAVEGVVLLPEGEDYSQIGVKNSGLHFVTAGSKGVLRVWEASSGRCVFTQPRTAPAPASSAGSEAEDEEASPQMLTHCLPLAASARLATVSAEHNIVIYQLPAVRVLQQFVGYSDEVLDIKFLGKNDSHIVVATNSSHLKVYELSSNSCQILYGHTDTVLSLDVFRKGSMFASCGKDRTLRVWRLDEDTAEVHCVAQGSGHSDAVGTVACCTIKLWDLPHPLPLCDTEPSRMTARATEKGHEKDVNSLTVSPNDKLLASGSQDRTARLWSLPDLSLLAVFRGHRRGVWSVQFSPADQVLATSSADGTVKIWGLHDFSCLKTFEGHDASVLKVVFVSRGTQILTGGSDGLVKLWTIKTNECVQTLDAHQDKVWGLHNSLKDSLMVTGSADSNILIWKDVTEEELEVEQAKEEEQILKQQELSNLLHEKNFLKALGLAISLDQPHTVLRVIKEIQQSENGAVQLEKTILKLRQDQKEALLRYSVVWNTNARSCLNAQVLLKVLLTHLPPEELLQYQGARGNLEALIPYTERHLKRIGHLLQSAMFLDYMWQQMRLTGGKPSIFSTLLLGNPLLPEEEEEEDQHIPDDLEEMEDSDTTTVNKARANGRATCFQNGTSRAERTELSSSEESEEEEGTEVTALQTQLGAVQHPTLYSKPGLVMTGDCEGISSVI